MGIIKFILVTVLVLYLIRILIRLIFPMVLRNLFSKAQEQAQNQRRPADIRPEGDISIEYMPPKEKKGNSDKLGDFVDYEEIK